MVSLSLLDGNLFVLDFKECLLFRAFGFLLVGNFGLCVDVGDHLFYDSLLLSNVSILDGQFLLKDCSVISSLR